MHDRREPPLIRALRDPARYDGEPASVELAETHISWVLLAGDYAYKIKKPVKFPFADFSTLEKRKHYCEEELRLNRRLAASIYLAVISIGGDVTEPALGNEPAIEYAVKMRRFPTEARVDRRLARGTVEVDDVRRFAAALAAFHAGLQPAPPDAVYGSPALIIRTALDNLRDVQETVVKADLATVKKLREWTEERCTRLEGVFLARKRAGFVRECHGDLHLQNLVYLGDSITPFDALEFEPELRWSDVMSETAFVVMDFMAHGRSDLAHELLNRYLEITGDYAGLDVLRFYAVHRALVRAKVAAIRKQQLDAATDEIDYLQHASRLTSASAPLLVITRGLSGSGKTDVTSDLIGGLEAVRIRSDLERKRLHGHAAFADTGSRVGEGLYAGDASERTYAALERYAASALEDRWNVIVDATFLQRAERAKFHDLAVRARARFVVLDITAPERLLRERIAVRRKERRDASEATAEVLDYQLERAEPLDETELEHTVRIDTSRRVDVSALMRRVVEPTG